VSQRIVRIGTRGSQLALAQSTYVRDMLAAARPDITFEISIVKTTGDRDQTSSLARIGGAGAFTKELEVELQAGRVDLAVHSLKDLPTQVESGLRLAAVSRREDPHDAVITATGVPLAQLSPGARVGTGSLRRESQLRVHRPDLQVAGIRGNVDTRIKKLHAGDFDAIVLACAGIRRIGRGEEITEVLPYEVMLPAPAQGALGIESRDEDGWAEIAAPIHDTETAACALAERMFLDSCGGGCRVPIGALGVIHGSRLDLQGVIAAPDGSSAHRGSRSGDIRDAETIGRALAAELLSAGAQRIIDGIREEPGV